eukprot:9869771-Alexandrium_andersonii.AAC.1
MAYFRGAFWCWACGMMARHTSTRLLGLAEACKRAPNKNGKENLARISKGLYPRPGFDWPLPEADE